MKHNWTKKGCKTCKHHQGVKRLRNHAGALESFVDCYHIGYVRMGMSCRDKERPICQAWTPKTYYKPGNGEDIIREVTP